MLLPALQHHQKESSSRKAVENGMKSADNTAKSLVSVVKGSEEVLTSMDKISNASQNQKIILKQLTENVDLISNVVQSNSSAAQNSAEMKSIYQFMQTLRLIR